MNNEAIKQLAKAIRREIIESAYATGKVGVHIGPALSLVDYLTVLYGGAMHVDPKNPMMDDRDRFILSKGHGYAAFYSTLSVCGFFSQEEFRANYMTDGGLYPAHPIKQLDKGIECSSGSLGMGLSFAVGKALAAKKRGMCYTTYVAMGDGECNEGSAMEALLSAAQFGLDNLVVFIDHNGYQQDGLTKDIMNSPLAGMAREFGCNVAEIDGNDVDAIIDALEHRPVNGKPLVIVGHTIKGKGISFMENVNSWHHASLNEEQYNQALNELNENGL
jgi:transketolase